MVAAVVITFGPACTPKPDGPEPTAEQFFAALIAGDTGAAAELSDRPADARQALNNAWAGLQATRFTGDSVVFQSTMRFTARTAALR